MDGVRLVVGNVVRSFIIHRFFFFFYSFKYKKSKIKKKDFERRFESKDKRLIDCCYKEEVKLWWKVAVPYQRILVVDVSSVFEQLVDDIDVTLGGCPLQRSGRGLRS